MPASRPAISYSRFSDPKQGGGDSESRQARDFADFCKRHKLAPTPAQEHFVDRGLSGYHGRHRTKGALGRLIALAKEGRFGPDTVIVVEAWDRLGRLRPDRQTELVAELLRTGVSIGVCRLNDIFTEEDFGGPKWTILSTFIMLAHQESKQKSERVAESWKQRKLRARSQRKLMTTILPAWLEARDGKPRLIPERAAAVRRIFDLAGAGYGVTRIVGKLTAEGVPAFGERKVKEGRKRSKFAGVWTRPYVRNILNDRRALGEHQPLTWPERKPDGPPIRDYYPPVVSEEQWVLTRATMMARDLHKGEKEPYARQRRYVNVFQSLLRHALDGDGFQMHNRGTRDRPELTVMTNKSASGRGPVVSFPYHILEQAVLKMLREIDQAEVLPVGNRPPDRLEVLRAKLGEARRQIAALTEDLRKGYSPALTALVREQEAAEARLKEDLEREQAEAARPAEHDWQEFRDLAGSLAAAPDLAEALAAAPDADDVRLRLRAVLRRRVESIRLQIARHGRGRLAVVQVWFAEGGRHRDYAIYYKQAARNCAGGWWVRSVAGDLATLDLRDPKDAAELAKALAALSVE